MTWHPIQWDGSGDRSRCWLWEWFMAMGLFTGLWACWSRAGVAEGRWPDGKWEYSVSNALSARWGPAGSVPGPQFLLYQGLEGILDEVLPSGRRPDQWVPAAIFWHGDQQISMPVLMCLICFKIWAVQRVDPREDKLHATDLSSRAKNVHSLLLSSQLYSVSFHFL